MSCRIDSLEVKDFRGIRDLCLSLRGRNLVVVGQNGSGKSSIVDAVEYFFTGRVEQLEGRADVKTRQCIPNVLGNGPRITMELVGGSVGGPISIGYPRRTAHLSRSARRFLDGAAQQTLVLRRYQVLQFINARDAERYRRMSELIGLGALDAVDRRWGEARRDAYRRVTELKERLGNGWDQVSRSLGQPVESEAALLEAINSRLAEQGVRPIGSRSGLSARLAILRQSRPSEAELRKAERLRGLHKTITKTGEELEALRQCVGHLLQALTQFWEQSETLDDASLEPLLSQCCRLLEGDGDRTDCPVCEAPVHEPEALLSRLRERLVQLRALTAGRENVQQRKAVVIRTLASLESLVASFHEGTRRYKLDSHAPSIEAALAAIRGYRRVLDGLCASSGRGLPELPAHLDHLRELLPELAYQVSEKKLEAVTASSGDGHVDLLVTVSQVRDQWKRLQQIGHAFEKACYVYGQIDLVHSALVEARKMGLGRLRASLEGGFERFYRQLHPNEGYGAIEIPVQEKKRSSVGLLTSYHGGTLVHPLNYFSEGHMDSLGLCVFLAFVKRFRGDLGFMVLDDVLTTMDGEHRARVAHLLAKEFKEYQLMITTHDHSWASHLEQALPDTAVVRLGSWSLEQGVTVLGREDRTQPGRGASR